MSASMGEIYRLPAQDIQSCAVVSNETNIPLAVHRCNIITIIIGYHTYIPAGWLISACGELGCLSALCPDVAGDGPYDAVNSWNH